jgi:hypothetical protein
MDNLRTGHIAIQGIAIFGEEALELVLARTKAAESPVRSAGYLTLSAMLDPDHRAKVHTAAIATIKAALVRGSSDAVYGVRISAIQGLAKLPGDDITAILKRIAESDPFSRDADPGKPRVFPVRNAASQALAKRSKLAA